MRFPKFDLNIISKYRGALMGVSILMVLFCHARMLKVPLPEPLLYILQMGDKGVDIFLFLSGVGLYYSLLNREEQGISYLIWFKKRFKRILIPYLILEVPYWLFYCISNNINVLHTIYYVSFVSFWKEHIGAWFLAFLLPLYLVSPFIYKISLLRFKNVYLILLVFLFLYLSIIPHDGFRDYERSVIANIQFCLERIPCFILGMFLGQEIRDHRKISYLWLLAPLVIFGVMNYLPVIRCFHRGWLTALLFTEVIIVFLHNSRRMTKAMSILGVATLEIYVSMDCVNNLLYTYMPLGGAFYLVEIGSSIVLGFCLHSFLSIPLLSTNKSNAKIEH